MSETATSNRHLLAVLAADLVGYSALMARDQDNALAVIRELRHRILEPRIIENGGQVIKRMGDGWLAGFSSVMDATACALEVQRDLAEARLPRRETCADPAPVAASTCSGSPPR